MEIDVGRTIAGKYELVRLLGRGSMGEVWVALHGTLNEEVAVKLLTQHVDGDESNPDFEDPKTAAARFLFEAQVAARLSRKTRHIVSVTDHGEEQGLPYLVMELLEGETLEARLDREGPLPLDVVGMIASQVGRALSQAHAEGVFHRDLKPANVFLMRDEEGRLLVKLLDFGIARVTHAHRTSKPPHATHATARGVVFGTPSYMSPEQARGSARLDQRCDLWALATILYECASGELPVEGTTTDRVMQNLCAGRIVGVRTRSPGLPESLDAFFVRAFGEEVGDRFATAAELVAAFEGAVGTNATRAGGDDHSDADDTLVVDSAHGSVLDRNALHHAPRVRTPASGARRAGRAAVKVLAGVSILLLLAAGVAARTMIARSATAPPSPASQEPSPSASHADRAPAVSAGAPDATGAPASSGASRPASDTTATAVPVTALPRTRPRPAQGGARSGQAAAPGSAAPRPKGPETPTRGVDKSDVF